MTDTGKSSAVIISLSPSLQLCPVRARMDRGGNPYRAERAGHRWDPASARSHCFTRTYGTYRAASEPIPQEETPKPDKARSARCSDTYHRSNGGTTAATTTDHGPHSNEPLSASNSESVWSLGVDGCAASRADLVGSGEDALAFHVAPLKGVGSLLSALNTMIVQALYFDLQLAGGVFDTVGNPK